MLLPKKTWIICRVCLKQRYGLHDIFEKISSFNIGLSLRDCGGVPIRKNDNLPDKICEQCLLHLWESYKFRLEVQRGHRELTHMLLERNYNIYEQELEEERKASSDIVKPSENKIKDDFEDPIKHEPKFDKKNYQTNIKTSSNNTITIQEDTRNSNEPEEKQIIEIANGPIKQYCIVKRKPLMKKEGKAKTKEKEESFKNAKQKRIILLLKLKNDTNTKNKLKAGTKTKSLSKSKSSSEVIAKPEKKTISKTKIKPYNNSKLCKTQQNNFTCKLCKKTFDTHQLLRHHNYTHNNPYQCKICGKTFSQSQALLSHFNIHSGDKPFNCRICNDNFSDQSNRNTHERTEHSEESKKYKCLKCDKKFRFLWMLEKHSNVHRSTKCFICGRVLATIRILRNHLQRIHLKTKNE